METSILDRFCSQLCESVHSSNQDGGQSEDQVSGEAFIQWLEAGNLFVIPLDEQRRWFRYHHLFQQLLQSELERQHDAEAIASLHHRAGVWLEDHGLFEEAVIHYKAGGAPDKAGLLVEKHGHVLIGEERVVQLERWLGLLPREVIEKNPMLLVFEAWIDRVKLQHSAMADHLNRAEALLQAESPKGSLSDCLRGYVNCIRSYERYCMLDHQEALACADRAVRLLPAGYAYMRSFAVVVKSATLQMKGQYQDAVSVMNSALGDVSLRDGYSQGLMLHTVSKVSMMEADFHAQRRTATRLLEMSKKAGLVVFHTWGGFNLACSLYHLNEPEAANRILASHMEDRYLLYPHAVSDSAAILSLSCQVLNQPHEAREVADLLDGYALETENPHLQMVGKALQAELDLRQGRLDAAIDWARVFEPRKLNAHYFFYLPEMTLARVLVTEDTQDSRQRAHSLLLDLEAFSRTSHNRSILIPILALQAILLDKQGDESAALGRLSESVSLAEPGGGLRFFLDQGPPMADLLTRLHKQNVAAAYIERILTAFEKGESGAVPDARDDRDAKPMMASEDIPTGGGRLLSNREVEILSLVAEGLSNKQIAAKLFVSVETIKKHLYHTYKKLGADSRISALTRARELGIFARD